MLGNAAVAGSLYLEITKGQSDHIPVAFDHLLL